MKGPAIRLHALNLGDRVRARFEHLFGAAGRGAGLLVNESVAEAVLVDMDTDDAAQCLAAYRQRNPARPALLLARIPPAAAPGDEVLLKPVVIRDLLRALQHLREALERYADADGYQHADTVALPGRPAAIEDAVSAAVTPDETRAGAGIEQGEVEYTPTVVVARRSLAAESSSLDAPGETASKYAASAGEIARWADLCGSREDVDPHDDEAVTGLWLSADGLLLPRLAAAARQAIEGQRALEVHAGRLKIVLDGAGDHAWADNDAASVRALCAGGPVAGDMTVVPAGKPKAVLLNRSGNPTAHWPTVESAVWQVALWTYRGQLPAGTSLDERVYLSRWPNFTRLVELPHALRIAAVWVEQPMALAATAALLGLPQRYVFALYGAAHALGLSGPARRGADHLFETPPAMLVPHRPLLGRLVRRLRAAAPALEMSPARATG